MKINYQIMEESQKNSHGMYIPDFEKLIAGATCEEETEYLKKVQERHDKRLSTGFAFNMVYVTRQTCGHFEIFQIPCNEYYSLEDNLKEAEEHAESMMCTHCISGISRIMKRDEYLKRALELYDSGQVNGEVYDAIIMNADTFCDDEEDEGGLPETYAEIEYSDFDNPEAITGAGFDDMNYLRYMER